MRIPVDELLAWARQHEADDWVTLEHYKPFRFRVTGSGIKYMPGTGVSRPVPRGELESFCAEVERVGSWAPGRYPKRWHKSYSLPLIQRFVAESRVAPVAGSFGMGKSGVLYQWPLREYAKRVGMYMQLHGEQFSHPPVVRGVQRKLVNEAGIFRGGRGIWYDGERTRAVDPAGLGVTVGLLHTGSAFPEDLTEEGVLYHYPVTDSPGRDKVEVHATKAAGLLRLPLFVVTHGRSRGLRDVYWGWVQGWDDDARVFWIAFGDRSPRALQVETPGEEAPFELQVRRRAGTATQKTRPGQQGFRLALLQRYGLRCAVCPLAVYEMLDAIHMCPVEHSGSDDPRNGLLMCKNHHVAFDKGLFGIEPETLRLRTRASGPDLAALAITEVSLAHLPATPHPEALRWAWSRWEKRPRPALAE